MLVQTPSLLIADDDRDFRETLRLVFEPRGFHTLLAGDGEEALDLVHSETVHLLLIDMHMPRLTGLETLCRIKAASLALPSILLSADMNDALAEQARQADVFCVLSKPVRFAELRGLVHRALSLAYDWFPGA